MPQPQSNFYSDSIFWIEVDKVKPNPYQPRKEFDEARLRDLADSILMYGILQPLVVTRKEIHKEDGGLSVEYELISGERRLRASKLAGIGQVPALIRNGHEDERIKLELAIIENLQREDLNPVDRARAFQRLAEEFNFKHIQIGEKVGKSREYVSNTLRLLSLPPEIIEALSQGKITEGHCRPLMMLNDRPQEQNTLFREIMLKKMTVREAESIGRRIAYDKIRKKEQAFDPRLMEIEEKLTETLGTRVQIERRAAGVKDAGPLGNAGGAGGGGKIHIEFFSDEDLSALFELIQHARDGKGNASAAAAAKTSAEPALPAAAASMDPSSSPSPSAAPVSRPEIASTESSLPIDDRSSSEKIAADETTDDDDLYSIKNFVV